MIQSAMFETPNYYWVVSFTAVFRIYLDDDFGWRIAEYTQVGLKSIYRR